MDREYNRVTRTGTPVTYVLVGINLAVFLIGMLMTQFDLYFISTIQGMPYRLTLENVMSISVEFITQKFWIWSFVTYGFAHGGFYHILFNMLALLSIGSVIERKVGSRSFLSFYMVTLVGAGVVSFLYYWVLVILGDTDVLMLGASGAVFGVLLAFAVFFPENRLMIFGLIPVKSKFLLLGYTGISIVLMFLDNPGSGNSINISHIGHLSGILVGWLYFVLVFKINPWKSLFGRSPSPPSQGY